MAENSATLDGGEKLRAALAAIARGIRGGGMLKVGFLSGATYPSGIPVAMVAAVHNWGAPSRNIPARPFFSNMVARRSSEWPGDIISQLKSTNYNAAATMNRMGALIRGQLQESIRDGGWAPLKPATVRRKGFSQPLIDQGIMLNAVAYEYEER